MHSVHPLDWDAVLASPLPLKVGRWVGGRRAWVWVLPYEAAGPTSSHWRSVPGPALAS